jgi:hypothetical protein
MKMHIKMSRDGMSTETPSTPPSVLSNWTLLMSCTEICVLLIENTYNEVIATLILLLSATGLLLDQLSDRKGSSLVIVTFQVLLLFSVLAIVACAHTAQSPIDMNAYEFFWVPQVQKRLVFGSTLDPQNVLVFLELVYFYSLCTSGVVGMAAVAMRRWTAPTNRSLFRGLLCSLLSFTMVLAGLWLVPYCFSLFQQTRVENHSNLACWMPPPTTLQRKPNIVILTIDSLRADLLSNESMPNTLKELHARKPGSSLVEWKHHDSGAVHSDGGFAALYYSMLGATKTHFKLHRDNPNITSWPLAAFRSNGYQMHNVIPYPYGFCWSIMDDCELFVRDFDNQHLIDYHNKTSRRGNKEMFADLRDLFEQWSEEKDPPMLISVDLQELHYPYSFKRRQGMDYIESAMNNEDVDVVKRGRLVTKENKKEIRSREIDQSREECHAQRGCGSGQMAWRNESLFEQHGDHHHW